MQAEDKIRAWLALRFEFIDCLQDRECVASRIMEYVLYIFGIKKFHNGITEMNPYLEDADGNKQVNKMVPLISDVDNFDPDLGLFMSGHGAEDDLVVDGYDNDFFPQVALPMAQAWKLWKVGAKEDAMATAGTIVADDWRLACLQWMERRIK